MGILEVPYTRNKERGWYGHSSDGTLGNDYLHLHRCCVDVPMD